ncbi:hypothetical protein DERP_007903 [Dermatophagoides pteronyssinus]|uniref:Uncharacterized protein n=1 Tax=Dermatophagoides pteronyssinus TaxID=6956 RepID=A0ABQ8ITA0_DERPT|nr:hypothetical protein DERP_007903 [Dermatophagoides pteronyssinus]
MNENVIFISKKNELTGNIMRISLRFLVPMDRRSITLLQRTNTSPRLPVQAPSIYSSVFANCKFIYASTETRNPLYSIPHFNLTIIGLPVKPFRNGFGFNGNV